ncbi:Uncharacterised protein [Mycobacteroides abscessus subsp. abscessus]|nr:Uncharacterised protein [Mycobacteroides abscessus subsp. abscessus]
MGSRPARMRISVLLPEPFGPVIATCSPTSIFMESGASASDSPRG